ncbi:MULTISPECIES: hypothetical protein [Glycomyces]|uniref:DUF4333 domain-containing protein n=2 Tax=Glycomyces TaxID=58113 RepID=A0A9X3PKS6_9ACTN|nr:hypothetical protein [Glycomyces lechevalierae]MDA1385443.1 hypothetical protein [Glycomyces lechevalierae]MDR7339720.1 hypothetical protein [Glycomyces lechevalierae]
MPIRYTAVLPVALAALGLAACSAEAGPTVSGIDVQVAAEPNGGEAAESAAEETSSAAPPADEAGLEIPAEDLASAAADALEEQVGMRPEIDCGDGIDIIIYEGRQTYCDLIDGESVYEVTITVTSIEGTAFDFDIEVADAPK